MRKPAEEEEWAFRSLSVVQDFYSKRAVAHASFFVASVFGLFTVLRLIYEMNPYPASQFTLSVVYIGVWIFGGYSFLNFSFYATIANSAQKAIHRLAAQLEPGSEEDDSEDTLINQKIKEHDEAPLGFERIVNGTFFRFKTGRLKEAKDLRGTVDLIALAAFFFGGLFALFFVLLRI